MVSTGSGDRRSATISPSFGRHSIVDVANLSFLGVLLVTYLLGVAYLPRRGVPLAAYLGLWLLLLGAVRLRGRVRPGGLKDLALFAYPVVFLFLSFESLSLTLPYVTSRRFDGALAALDRAVLGMDPTVWMERLASPLLTDLLSAAYLFYFPMPLILLGWLLARGLRAEVEDGIFRYLVCYYGAYVGYFLVPAQGPRYFLAGEHQGPLAGILLADPIRRFIDVLEPNKLDVFPSLHAAILVLTLLLSYRRNRRMFAWFAPCGAAIFISLVYLRYHYVVDVAAGVAWAFIADRLAGAVAPRLARRLVPHFGEGR